MTSSGRLRRHCVIGYADPGQNPSAVRSGGSRVRGRGLDRQRYGRCSGVDPLAVMTTGAPRGPVSDTTRGDASRVEAAAWQSLGESGHGPAPRDSSHGRVRRGAGNCRSIASSVNRFVNRTRRDRTRRGRRNRRSETGSVLSAEVTTPAGDGPRRGETHVVWLITQRSRVQIPPSPPRSEALSRTEKGPSACGLRTDL